MNIKKSAIGFAIFFGWYLLARAVDKLYWLLAGGYQRAAAKEVLNRATPATSTPVKPMTP
ncbi:MAG TPA: hypothetical protein PLT00_14585 [Verrucomicrobiota bacterium]|jgi:hypothetical protein|nr:hypothetical protein [Verrucomicrobiota bacterium]HQB17927.1 hypothetical protein [Verrucomicrobiota bacterium]